MSYGRLVLLLLVAITTLALAGQLLIDFNAVNVGAACIAYASSMAVLLYLLWTPALKTHPLSTFVVFGFCFTTQLGALLGQSAHATSLTNDLRQPLETFAILAGFQAMALLAHVFYRWVLNPAGASAGSLPRLLLNKLGVYDTPSTGVLWFMGYVGLVAFVLGGGGGGQGAFVKTMQGLSFLAWAPFLIPIYMAQLGETYARWSKQLPFLVLFAGLVVLLGLAANARIVMLSGFITIALFSLLSVLRSELPVRAQRVLQVSGVGLVLVALAIPLSDLATAMVVARKVRGNVSAPQMVQETLRHFRDPEALAAQRESQASATSRRYDEFYFSNPLMARLVETKFQDNALFFASTLSRSDVRQLAATSLDQVWAILPDPVLSALRVGVNKRDLDFSMGDYLSHLSQGDPLGGRRTGSMLAQGLALFGVGFIPLHLLMCLVAFALVDLQAQRNRQGTMVLSAVGMLAIWKLFQYGVAAESLHGWLTLLLRGLPQNIVLFLLVALLAQALGGLFGPGRQPKTPSTLRNAAG